MYFFFYQFIEMLYFVLKFNTVPTLCMFCRKIGTEGSVLLELCHFVILTARCLP